MKYAPPQPHPDEQIDRAEPSLAVSPARESGVGAPDRQTRPPTTSTLPVTARSAPRRASPSPGWNLSPKARKAVVAAHIVVSVGLLGISASLLFLGGVASLSIDPEAARVASRAMRLFSRGFVQPVALATLLTGLILSFGTKWDLFRYYWIVVKLVLTIATVLSGIFLLGPAVDQTIAATSVATGRATVPAMLLVAATANVLMLGAATIISVYKPWGTIGRRGVAQTPIRSVGRLPAR